MSGCAQAPIGGIDRNEVLGPHQVNHQAHLLLASFFFFNNPPPTDIYPLPLHDALPVLLRMARRCSNSIRANTPALPLPCWDSGDRKSTRLNSSHLVISYAVFCLKK